jgi:hypothetical protein
MVPTTTKIAATGVVMVPTTKIAGVVVMTAVVMVVVVMTAVRGAHVDLRSLNDIGAPVTPSAGTPASDGEQDRRDHQ